MHIFALYVCVYISICFSFVYTSALSGCFFQMKTVDFLQNYPSARWVRFFFPEGLDKEHPKISLLGGQYLS